jgi:NAD(P)-dependent dehydrogenase (short-subunit alcohol dehydrogenase family)
MRLQGKVAIITGAAQGIGRAYAERFAKEGAAVAIVDLREAQAGEVERAITKGGGRALALKGDVTSPDSMAGVAKTVVERLGRIDVLINNAAIYYDLNLADQSLEYTRKVVDVNLFGVIVATRAVFPHMKRQRSGAIVNISSTAAYPLPGMGGGDVEELSVSGYSLAKSGVIFLTKAWAGTLGQYKIRVNAIAPGPTMSEATKHVVPPPFIDALVNASALHEALEPADLAGAAVFLASEDSAKMTGQTLVVDAGLVMLG